MCGIAGFLGSKGDRQHLDSVLKSMIDRIVLRGPDDWGVWSSEQGSVYLGHRRLSILDLSPMGHQPMESESGRYKIVFNGEIYNHLDLRSELLKNSQINWRGHSDTETLLAGFEQWGISETIKKSVGMFAIAVWDGTSKKLYLVRDRAGEKPLYYGKQGTSFLFASELKAFKAHPDFRGEIQRSSIALFLRHNYIPAPHSIYCGIYKLKPGHILEVSPEGDILGEESYWSLNQVIDKAKRSEFDGTPEDASVILEGILQKSISRQMLSDVPLGAFLSGGIDSSTVVALMQAQSSLPVKTFSIGFNVKGYNEAEHAKVVAKHLGTDHTEMYVEASDALSVVPKISSVYDEPFADSSQVPTFLVSELARKHVTVSLSGDAGDELFGGYNRYLMVNDFWRKITLMPDWVRKSLAELIFSKPLDFWNHFFSYIPAVSSRVSRPGEKLYKLGYVLDCKSIKDVYKRIVSHHEDPSSLLISAEESDTILTRSSSVFSSIHSMSDIEFMMALDFITYLPDDILVKVDRAAMGVSLETRVPFLDHNVIEFAWSLPLNIKIRNGQTKWPLKNILYQYVPKVLIERPKMGFGIPLDDWLKGPLREWVETLLSKERLIREGYFKAETIENIWRDHLSGKKNSAYLIWNIVMFQAWLGEQ